MNIAQALKERSRPFYSLEFFPPKDSAEWPAFFGIVEQLTALDPLFVSVTCGAGGSTQSYTLDIASRLKRDYGLEPMPHLTCVGATADSLRAALDGFEQAGISNVMALRGDKPRDAGPDWNEGDFRHADALVRFIREDWRKGRAGFGVGVAAYPAPHPESPSFRSDRERLAGKIRAGADLAVTQLFFDSREYFALAEAVRAAGLDLPIIPGVLPIQSLASIRRTLSMCGANIPGALYLQLEEAHAKGGTEAVKEAGLAFAVDQIRRLLDGGAPGVHLYTLNRAELCLRIADEVGRL
ncbi:MAG: methylenetetrahydrofolate reductase [Desulfovibrionaceae bacterium]|nr:methylenetetrahydrofolate reductase [Desulfovibrionaceae bacterium]